MPNKVLDLMNQTKKDITKTLEACKEFISQCGKNHIDVGDISDGYHAFNDLYYQRLILSATLFNTYKTKAWKSTCHEDGCPCFGGGWFIVGIDTPEGSYTYHYEMKYWDLFDVKVLDRGKEWDGHTSDDVDRLLSLVRKRVL